MARPPNPNKYSCKGVLPGGGTCGSTNLRFRADGHTYQCYACGHNGDKVKEEQKASGGT